MKKEVVETTMVTPSEEMRRQGLWLSNLDLQSPHIYTTVLNYYPAPAGRPEHRGGACDPERLKVALARALVPFYPLAGRLSLGEDGRRYVDCNGEGVRFFVARADVTGPELFDDYQPSPEVTETFVPNMPPEELPCLVALFQLTFLKCGEVVLTSSFHHALIDGTGLFHFMQSWSRLARGLDAAEAVGPQAPFHDRTSLRARAPPLQQMGVGDPAPPAAHSLNFAATSCPRAFVARVYPFPHTLVHELTSRCCRAASVSRFAAVTAHIWRCMCVARRLAPDSDTHLGVIVNVRARLRPPLPHSFFGNAALQAPALPRRVGDVIDGPPASVVGMIMDAVNSVDDTYVRSVVDYHEVPKENLVLGAMEPPESDVAMVSWLGMPLYDADFGWGVPELVMPTTVSVFSGMVLVLPRGLDKESGIIVVVNLEPEYLPAFKKLLYDVVL